MRVAAVDCGTNSIKLLVTDLDPRTGQQGDLVRENRIVRLGAGVDRTGRLSPEALARTLAAADDYGKQIRTLGAEQVTAAATSATRDASNGQLLVTGLRQRLGTAPRVLSGVDEARFSFTGAVHGLGGSVSPELLLVDIGGGSTELVRGHAGTVSAVGSADVGSVRLTERHLRSDPPSTAQVAAARADVEAALDGLEIAVDGAEAVVVVGGTAMTVTAHTLGLEALDVDRLHGTSLDSSDVRASCAALVAATVAERRAMPFMHPGRADVIGGGALVLDRVLQRVGPVFVVPSGRDVLDGLAWSLVTPAGAP